MLSKMILLYCWIELWSQVQHCIEFYAISTHIARRMCLELIELLGVTIASLFCRHSRHKLLMIAFVRFLHSTTSCLVSKEHPQTKQIFASLLLERPAFDVSQETLWSILSDIGEDIVKGYRTVCSSSDGHVVQDCLKNLLSFVRKCCEEKAEESHEDHSEC